MNSYYFNQSQTFTNQHRCMFLMLNVLLLSKETLLDGKLFFLFCFYQLMLFFLTELFCPRYQRGYNTKPKQSTLAKLIFSIVCGFKRQKKRLIKQLFLKHLFVRFLQNQQQFYLYKIILNIFHTLQIKKDDRESLQKHWLIWNCEQTLFHNSPSNSITILI